MKTPNSLFPTLCSSSGSYHGPSQTHAHGISLLCTIIPYYSYFTICSYFGLSLAFYINSCQYLRRNFRVPDSNPCLFPQMVLSMPLTNSSCFDIFFSKALLKPLRNFSPLVYSSHTLHLHSSPRGALEAGYAFMAVKYSVRTS